MTEGIANANVTNPSNIYAINLLPNDAFLWATHFVDDKICNLDNTRPPSLGQYLILSSYSVPQISHTCLRFSTLVSLAPSLLQNIVPVG